MQSTVNVNYTIEYEGTAMKVLLVNTDTFRLQMEVLHLDS